MTAVAVVALLVVHNIVANLWFPAWSYVPVNLATAGAIVALAGPVSVGEPGLGVVAALLVLGTIAVVARVPRWRGVLADQRMAGVDGRGTAWRALVRIPLGTVVLEEVAFRGVLPALMSPVLAALLFGLWHIVPTVKTLETNGVGRGRAFLVAGAVAVTAVVGLFLWELRLASGGLLAPALVHAAANSGATVAAYAVLRSAPAQVAAADPPPDVAAEQAEEQPS